jgi:hypothetical protein
VVALFRRDGASRKPELVRRFLRSKKTEWKWIARPVDGVAVTSADVIILREEYERCERAFVCCSRHVNRVAPASVG